MSLLANEIYAFGPYRISLGERVLRRGAEIVPLTPKCVDTLLVLARNPGQVVDKETLMRAVWADAFVEEGSLAQNIFTLRKVLGETPEGQRYIQTIPKRGYLLVKPETDAALPPAPVPTRMAPVSAEPPPTPPKHASRTRYAFAVAAGLAIALAVAGWLGLTGRGRSPEIRITPLTVPNNIVYGVISSDGSHISYVSDDPAGQSLWIRSTTALDAGRRIVDPQLGSFWGIAFAPSGDALYYSFEDRLHPAGGVLYRIAAAGGPSSRLFSPAGPVVVSPDGQRLLFKYYEPNDRGYLLTAPASGGEPKVIATSGASYSFYSYGWAGDGHHIRYVEGNRQANGSLWSVFEVPAGGGTAAALLPGQSKPLRSVVWLSRSEILAIVPDESASSSQIWRLSAAAAPQRLTTGLSDYTLLSPSADGRTVLATSRETQDSIWTLPAAGGDPISLRLPVGSYNDPVWTPDGRVVYIGQSNIWIASPDGGQRKPLLSTPVDATEPAVSRDGRFLVFVRQLREETNLWRVNLNGGGLRQLTTGRLDLFPALSPDGRWMIYVAVLDGKWGISKAPLDAPERAVRLVDNYAQRCVIAPDGARFAFSDSAGAIQIRSFADGSLLSSLPAPPDASDLAWSADGAAITYVSRAGEAVWVWRQPTRAGSISKPPTRLGLQLPTNTRAVAFTPGDDRLVYLRRDLKVDLALISDFR